MARKHRARFKSAYNKSKRVHCMNERRSAVVYEYSAYKFVKIITNKYDENENWINDHGLLLNQL